MAYAKKTWTLDDSITDVALNNIETGVDTAHDVLDATGTPASLSAATTNAIGTATAKAKADHTHSVLANGTPSTQAIGDAASVGTSSHLARADHKHAMPTFGSGATNVVAGNRLRGGVYNNSTTTNSVGTTPVLFDQPFPSVPVVAISHSITPWLDMDKYQVEVVEITTTGFKIRHILLQSASATRPITFTVNWIAMTNP